MELSHSGMRDRSDHPSLMFVQPAGMRQRWARAHTGVATMAGLKLHEIPPLLQSPLPHPPEKCELCPCTAPPSDTAGRVGDIWRAGGATCIPCTPTHCGVWTHHLSAPTACTTAEGTGSV